MTALTEDVQFTERIDFPSRAENIALVEKMIDDVCGRLQVHESHYGNILIALTEAVNNAIHHGNRQDASKQVTVGYHVDGDRVVFVVKDQGAGFDHDHLPDPTDPENIEKPHGRGVFLMRALADDIAFSDNGATVAMAFSTAAVKE
ncbi:MAG: ATP-binding protein [Flavobacteriales bacterium]|nr:ATP-binding protein [Flavobacteriales bacterium]